MSTEPFDQDLTPAAHESGLTSWMRLVSRHKSLIALGVVVGLVLGTLAYVQKAPVYQTTAQLIVTKKQTNPLPGDADPRNFFYEDYLATHQILIRSPEIVNRAVKDHRLRELRTFQGHFDLVGTIRTSLVILRDGKDPSGPTSNVLNLAYSCTDSKDAATVLDAVIQSYTGYLDEKFRLVSKSTLAELIRARDAGRKELDEARAAYLKFKQESPLIYSTGKDGATLEEDWLGQISAKRLNLLMVRAEVQGRLDGIRVALREGRGRQALLAQITATSPRQHGPNGENEPRVHEKLYDLMLKEQMLLADFGPDHPEVRSVRTRMEMTRNFFARGAAGKDDDPVEWHMQSLQQQLDDIDHSLASLKQMSAVEERRVRGILKDKATAQYYQTKIAQLERQNAPVEDHFQRIDFFRDLGGFDVQVIAPPVPGTRTGAGAVQIILLGGILGLMAGFGLAYLAEATDRSFRTPEEIRGRLGLPVIGHVPVLRPDAATMLRLAEGQTCLDPLLCTLHRPKSSQAEAFRGVRTALYFTTQGENHQVIQITSPSAADGKSTLAANLAVCIAQTGKKVILLDADFRKPRQHRIFAVQAKEGLASVVAGDAELKDVVHPTAVPGLFLLPCGKHPQNPAELLTGEAFKELLDVLREEYDFVVVDTPPLLAVSDPSAVAPRVDGVLLAIRISKNGRPNAERAQELLKTLGANVIGVVVIGTGEESGYGYYGSYSYHEEGGYYRDESEDGPAESFASPPETPTKSERERRLRSHTPATRRQNSERRLNGLWNRLGRWWGLR